MATVEKVSIALPTDMLTMVRKAVDGGDYASSSEVVREALREWKARRIAAVDAGAARPSSAMRKARPASVARGVSFPLTVRQRQAIATLCQGHGVHALALFGSILREDFIADASDIDVTVRFARCTDAPTARQYFDFKTALETLFDRPVDLVELDAMPESRLKRIIERTQVTVYEQVP